jgi:exonuclease III
MNVSTLGNRNSKTYIKIEGLTGKRTDIILFSDVRAGSKAKEIEGLFRMTKNGNYVTYINSTRNSRGVGIAIKKSISHKVHRRIEDRDTENYIILDVEIKNRRMFLGCVYGPNENNVEFYNKLRRELNSDSWPIILGGDFNTILDQDNTAENLDRIGAGRIPNKLNSTYINNWIKDGEILEPFRAMYPETREISYVSYRGVA